MVHKGHRVAWGKQARGGVVGRDTTRRACRTAPGLCPARHGNAFESNGFWLSPSEEWAEVEDAVREYPSLEIAGALRRSHLLSGACVIGYLLLHAVSPGMLFRYITWYLPAFIIFMAISLRVAIHKLAAPFVLLADA